MGVVTHLDMHRERCILEKALHGRYNHHGINDREKAKLSDEIKAAQDFLKAAKQRLKMLQG